MELIMKPFQCENKNERFLSTAALFHSACFASDADRKNKSCGETPQQECFAGDVTPGLGNFRTSPRNFELLHDQALNWIALELHEMRVSIKKCKTINCIQINASWPSCQSRCWKTRINEFIVDTHRLLAAVPCTARYLWMEIDSDSNWN